MRRFCSLAPTTRLRRVQVVLRFVDLDLEVGGWVGLERGGEGDRCSHYKG